MALSQYLLEQHFNRRFSDARDNWKACCPFHDERTPSFLVHKEELIANCFGCGEGGNIDTLLARYKGIDVREARTLLEIEIDEQLQRRLSLGSKQPDSQRYIPESWLAPWAKAIHPYTLRRGLSESVLKRAGTRYDRVGQRQVFPHRDSRNGRLLGCAGRTVREEDPKWYFYWNYEKGQHLYRPFVPSGQQVVIVEGIFDCLKLEEQGIHAAATLGTKVTNKQLEEIRAYEKVCIAFDNDPSGQEGSRRIYEQIRQTTQVRFVRWPEAAKDVMDLDIDLKDWIASAENIVQRQFV